MEEGSVIQVADGGDDHQAERDTRPPGSKEKRRGDRRAAKGRRQVDKDFTCFSAPFIAHCLSQFGIGTTRTQDDVPPVADQAYRKAGRRPGYWTPPA